MKDDRVPGGILCLLVFNVFAKPVILKREIAVTQTPAPHPGLPASLSLLGVGGDV